MLFIVDCIVQIINIMHFKYYNDHFNDCISFLSVYYLYDRKFD